MSSNNSVDIRTRWSCPRYGLRLVAAGALFVLLIQASPAHAGGIAGFIRDGATNQPVAGIDLDIFDASFSPVSGINDASAADGSYLLSPLPAGDYYLRADPGASDGYVDRYYPGVFLKSQATPIHVAATGTVIVNFSLEVGVVIGGRIADAGTGLALAGIDLDVYAADLSFIGSINDRTAADGTYRLGCFPPGTFYVKADPETTMYVPQYYSNALTIATATGVAVGSVAVGNVDFDLILGGKIGGILHAQDTGLPLAGIDLDLYDTQGTFLSYADGLSGVDGSYTLGAVLPGQYLLQADATALQSYVDTYYGDTFDEVLAVPITVTAGAVSGGTNINLPLGGTVSGVVTAAASGLPIAGLRISVFDSLGSITPGLGGNTAADGSYVVGAMPDGAYYLRASGDSALGVAFAYYPGVTLQSDAQLVTTSAGTNLPSVDFALEAGGWISGRIDALDSGLPAAGIDLDVYSTQLEFIGALDTESDAAGGYRLGPVPAGEFLLRAHPPLDSPYEIQYYDHQPSPLTATPIVMNPPAALDNIDFDLLVIGVAVDDSPPAMVRFTGAYPNPFNPQTTIVFELAEAQHVVLRIFDLRGRVVAELARGLLPAGRHEVKWRAQGEDGQALSSGIYLAEVAADGMADIAKLVLVR